MHTCLIFSPKILEGDGCPKLPDHNFSKPKSKDCNVGSRITYECIQGFRRELESNDTVTCINKDGNAIWEGEKNLVDCVENYCILPNPNPSNAKLTHLFTKTIPEGIQTNGTLDGKFVNQTILSYKCDEGYTFVKLESFNLTCDTTNSTSNGYGQWFPRDKNVCRGRIVIISFYARMFANKG